MEEEAGMAKEPSEEEMRAALEEELRKVRVEDLLLQSVASIVNLTARRIGKEDERDLGQAKVGIDAVTALVGLLPAEAAKQVRDALSQLRILYAQAAGEGPGAAAPEPGSGEPTAKPPQGAEEPAPPPAPEPPPGPPPPGGPKPPPRLWTPPGSG